MININIRQWIALIFPVSCIEICVPRPNRKLTDKPKDDKHEASSINTNDLREMGKGNNRYLPIFHANDSNSDKSPKSVDSSVETKVSPDIECDKESNEFSDAPQMVMYNGALIDIAKLMHQMARAETAREQTEQRIADLIKSNNDLQSSNIRAKDKIKDLHSELKSCNRKLNDAESGLSSANVGFSTERPVFEMFCSGAWEIL